VFSNPHPTRPSSTADSPCILQLLLLLLLTQPPAQGWESLGELIGSHSKRLSQQQQQQRTPAALGKAAAPTTLLLPLLLTVAQITRQ
jgi:hypothetical protein